MGSGYFRFGICTLKSLQRETAFSSVIGFLAPNSYSWKISKCRMICNISVGSDRWRVRLSPCLQEESGTLKAKRGLKFSNKFPKVSSLVSVNTLTTLPWKLKISPFILEGKMSHSWTKEEGNWKQIKTTSKKQQLKVRWF